MKQNLKALLLIVSLVVIPVGVTVTSKLMSHPYVAPPVHAVTEEESRKFTQDLEDTYTKHLAQYENERTAREEAHKMVQQLTEQRR